MKTVKGMPITGSRPQTSKKRPFVPNAKDTSTDAQTMIQEPPAPFKNRNTAAQIPSGSGGSVGSNLPVDKPRPGLQRSSIGAKALPQGAAVGQRKPINQSGQVNGRMGTSFPKKVGGKDLASKFPAKKNAAFYGE